METMSTVPLWMSFAPSSKTAPPFLATVASSAAGTASAKATGVIPFACHASICVWPIDPRPMMPTRGVATEPIVDIPLCSANLVDHDPLTGFGRAVAGMQNCHHVERLLACQRSLFCLHHVDDLAHR